MADSFELNLKKWDPTKMLRDRRVILVGRPGSGKCLKINTPVLMHNGDIKMVQDVVVGDLVMGDDSQPRTVLSTTTGNTTMYEINQLNGDTYTVNESHILSLKLSKSPWVFNRKSRRAYSVQWFGDRSRYSKNFSYAKIPQEEAYQEAKLFQESLPQRGTVIDIPVLEYINTTTSWKAAYKGYKVGVEYPEIDVEIDPYVLGCWLGDGTSAKPQITSIDQPIIDSFQDAYPMLNVKRGAGKYAYDVTTGILTGGNYRNPFLNALRETNVLNNKHIPREYLVNSREIRLQLLAGLLDTDGYLNKNACYEIIQKNKELASNIVTLSRSLGYRTTINECEKGCMYNGEMRNAIYQRVYISGADDIPTRLERKKSGTKRKDKNELVTGIHVKKIENDDYYGFSIDGNHRFLLGDFTVTHNSTAAVDLMYHIRDISDGVTFSPTDKFTGLWESFTPPISVHENWDSKIVTKVIDRQVRLFNEEFSRMVKESRENGGPPARKSDVEIEPVYIIADDCLADNAFLKDPIMNTLFMNGRHLKIHFLITSQWLLSLKIQQRQLVDYLIVCEEDSPPALMRLYDSFFSSYIPTYQAFCDIMGTVTKNFGTLVLDRTGKKSSSIEDRLFWWRPKLREPHSFRIGSDEFWKFSAEKYQEKLHLKETKLDAKTGMNRKSRLANIPRVSVRQCDENGNPM